jgi:MFS family permease
VNANEPRPATAAAAPPAPAAPTGTLIGSAAVAALGGLLFGFDTVVISGTTEALKTAFSLNESTLGFTVAIALIGTIFGSILAGRPADAWGRKTALIALAILYLGTSLGSALAWDWASFLAFGFLGGVAVGGASVVSPLYIAEISPARYRGRLVAVQQFNVVLGILLAFLSNYAIARLRLGATEWSWMLGVLAGPSALFFLLLIPTPESPRWLVGRGRDGDPIRDTCTPHRLASYATTPRRLWLVRGDAPGYLG